MMRFLTNDVTLRFLGGFAVGCVMVLTGATNLFHAIA